MLKSYFLKKKIQSNEFLNRKPSIDGFDYMKNITIVFELNDAEIAKVIKVDFEKENIKCNLICFVNSKEAHTYQDFELYISLNHLNFIGSLEKNIEAQFKGIEANSDVILTINSDNALILNYLTSISVSKLRVGVYQSPFAIFDFILDVPKNIDTKFLSQQIMFYLRKLKSKR